MYGWGIETSCNANPVESLIFSKGFVIKAFGYTFSCIIAAEQRSSVRNIAFFNALPYADVGIVCHWLRCISSSVVWVIWASADA